MIRIKTKLKNKARTIEGLYSEAVEVIYSEELSKILEQSEKEYREGKTFSREEILKGLYEEFGIQI
ncbi:MAG: hypothetical protein HFJ52_07360 [Clostridia bacterium]|nr:hypothetical protein [Clostridia bacterium]